MFLTVQINTMQKRYKAPSRSAPNLVSTSCTVFVSAWPRCRLPVTLGGGKHIMNMPLGLSS